MVLDKAYGLLLQGREIGRMGQAAHVDLFDAEFAGNCFDDGAVETDEPLMHKPRRPRLIHVVAAKPFDENGTRFNDVFFSVLYEMQVSGGDEFYSINIGILPCNRRSPAPDRISGVAHDEHAGFQASLGQQPHALVGAPVPPIEDGKRGAFFKRLRLGHGDVLVLLDLKRLKDICDAGHYGADGYVHFQIDRFEYPDIYGVADPNRDIFKRNVNIGLIAPDNQPRSSDCHIETDLSGHQRMGLDFDRAVLLKRHDADGIYGGIPVDND